MQPESAGDGPGLRVFVPAFEDLLSLTSRPYSPGVWRWFRSPNVSDLVAYRRNQGGVEWNERRWTGAQPPSNVVDFPANR
jgi:hypothetical protein